MSDTAQAETVNQAIMDEAVPMMPEANPNTLDLLRGIREAKDDKVVWHTKATVRDLTGEDEEFLATLDGKELLYTEYMSALLSRGVLNIGDIAPLTPDHLDKLILPDRELLMLGILRLTYGDTRELHTVCEQCKTLNTITIDLNEDFPIKEPDFDIRDGIQVEDRGVIYHLRVPNAEDTIAAQKAGKSDAKYNTAMLGRCLVFEDSAPADAYEYAKSMNLATRKKLINSLLELDIGPTLEGVDTQCAECGVTMPILLDWVSLLLS